MLSQTFGHFYIIGQYLQLQPLVSIRSPAITTARPRKGRVVALHQESVHGGGETCWETTSIRSAPRHRGG